jgi:hypothetical protein
MLNTILAKIAEYKDLDFYIDEYDPKEICVITVEDFEGDEGKAVLPVRKWCRANGFCTYDGYKIGDYLVTFPCDYRDLD